MNKEDILQIAEDAWALYENAPRPKREKFEQVLRLADILVDMVPADAASAESSTSKLAEILGSLVALAALRKNRLDFVGGRYLPRS